MKGISVKHEWLRGEKKGLETLLKETTDVLRQIKIQALTKMLSRIKSLYLDVKEADSAALTNYWQEVTQPIA